MDFERMTGMNYYYNPFSKRGFLEQWGDYIQNKSYVQGQNQAFQQEMQQQTREIGQAMEQFSADQQRVARENIEMVCHSMDEGFSQLAETINQGHQRIYSLIDWHMSHVEEELRYGNILHQLSNILLLQIAQTVALSDAQKVRQHELDMGFNFYLKAQFDAGMYDDALQHLQKAYDMEPTDYIAANRLGMLYLYSPRHLDLARAEELLQQSWRYAKADAALRQNYTGISNEGRQMSLEDIQMMAANSAMQAGIAAYAQTKFQDAAAYFAVAADVQAQIVQQGDLTKLHMLNGTQDQEGLDTRARLEKNQREAHFSELKARSAAGEQEKPALLLEELVRADRSYSLQAAADPDINSREYTGRVFHQLREEARNRLEQEIHGLQQELKAETGVLRDNLQSIQKLIDEDTYLSLMTASDRLAAHYTYDSKKIGLRVKMDSCSQPLREADFSVGVRQRFFGPKHRSVQLRYPQAEKQDKLLRTKTWTAGKPSWDDTYREADKFYWKVEALPQGFQIIGYTPDELYVLGLAAADAEHPARYEAWALDGSSFFVVDMAEALGRGTGMPQPEELFSSPDAALYVYLPQKAAEFRFFRLAGTQIQARGHYSWKGLTDSSKPLSLAFQEENRFAAFIQGRGFRVFDFARGTYVPLLDQSGNVLDEMRGEMELDDRNVAFESGGNFLVYLHSPGRVFLFCWEPGTQGAGCFAFQRQLIFRQKSLLEDTGMSLSFGPDGTILLAGGEETAVYRDLILGYEQEDIMLKGRAHYEQGHAYGIVKEWQLKGDTYMLKRGDTVSMEIDPISLSLTLAEWVRRDNEVSGLIQQGVLWTRREKERIAQRKLSAGEGTPQEEIVQKSLAMSTGKQAGYTAGEYIVLILLTLLAGFGFSCLSRDFLHFGSIGGTVVFLVGCVFSWKAFQQFRPFIRKMLQNSI